MVGKYKVITLCGSTRFRDAFMEAQKQLTLEGNIVISVDLFGHSGDEEVWTEGTKEMLDEMHKAKISMADGIFVINVGGYIGSSTRSEIAYAKAAGKAVQYLEEPFVFRTVRQEEAEQTAEIEAICFPPNEACKREHMIPRIAAAADFFWVAEDRVTGKISGFINGIATNETAFRDAFFTDASLHDPDGANNMILGLDVLPDYRGQGLARELVRSYAERNRGKRLVLTCLERLVPMYEKFGFRDLGESASVWGGERWHEMDRMA